MTVVAQTLAKCCSKCRVAKPVEAFGRRQSQCQSCQTDYMREYRKAGRHRNGEYLRRYGISLEVYETMLSAQGGVCAACGNKPLPARVLCVDHCHDTGRVRGLLCDPCNKASGLVRDDPTRLRAIADYLEQA